MLLPEKKKQQQQYFRNRRLLFHRQMALDMNFTITAEIHARSLANFYCQYGDRHVNLKFMGRVSKRARAIGQFVFVKKQIDTSL